MKKVIPFVLVIILLVSVGLVLAQGGLPGSGWKSGQQIQNVGTGSAKVVFTAYDEDGKSYDCGEKTIAPGASETYLTDTDCPVDAGFIGAAVVSADQAIAAIVNVNNRGTGAAAGQYQGTDGVDVDNTISFPLVKNNHSGRTTTFYVQNASTSPNTMTATFSVNGSTFNKTFSNVPANAMRIFTPSDAGVPAGQGQVGSLEVTGTQPLAGSSLEHQTTAAVGQNLQASKAFVAADGATSVFCPLYRNAHTKKLQTTGAQVQNVTNSSVTVNFTVEAGGTSYGPYTRTIAAGASETFYAPDLTSPSIPAGTVGSATIESTGKVVAVVNDAGTDNGVQRKTTYACFGSGGTTVNVPLAKEFAGGNTTGIQVQNVGASPTKVTLEYKNASSSLKIESTAAVSPGQSITAYGVSSVSPEWQVLSSTGSMAGTVNGVVITANQPVVAIANESSAAPNPSGQDTKNYEGFNQ
jgi:hypothetical protein